MSKTICLLVTGTAGFIGSNLVAHWLEANPSLELVSLDKLTYAGNLKNLAPVLKHPRHHFVQGDIGDAGLLARLFALHDFAGVVNLAAESHVDNSITGPQAFVETNIKGSFCLLEAARQAWFLAPFQSKPGCQGRRFLQVSTDEVYGSLGPEGLFQETTPYAPNSPYSASKASADLLVRSYHHTYGLNTVITNCSNNYGPRQHAEKLIPTIIRKALALEPIPIYGDGKNVRDWLYVLDHCRGIELAFEQGQAGETYNIGGKNEMTNLEILAAICRHLDQKRPRPDGQPYQALAQFVVDRPGHDRRYAIDASKIEAQLGWKAAETFGTGIAKTVDWYLAQEQSP